MSEKITRSRYTCPGVRASAYRSTQHAPGYDADVARLESFPVYATERSAKAVDRDDDDDEDDDEDEDEDGLSKRS